MGSTAQYNRFMLMLLTKNYVVCILGGETGSSGDAAGINGA